MISAVLVMVVEKYLSVLLFIHVKRVGISTNSQVGTSNQDE